MDSLASFKKYLLYSLSFHALVLALFLLFAEAPPPPPIPRTEVVMIRLGGGGNPRAPLAQKPPAPGPPTENVAPPPVPVAKPAPIEKPPAPPPTTAVKSKPAAPATPKEGSQVVHIGKQKPVPTKPTPTTSNANVPAKPKTPTAQDQQMQQALSQIQSELNQREKQQQAPSNPTEGTGQGQVPSFGAPGGGPVVAVDPGYAQYQSSVRSKIVREWIRTNSGPGEDKVLRTRISVRINASGEVIAKAVQRSSGDESFDLSAMRAIERASPLPPPPEGIKSEALSEGFVVDFNSRMLGSR